MATSLQQTDLQSAPPASAFPAQSLEELIANHDWAATPLGPMDQWPHSLQGVVRLMTTSKFPMWLGWGPDLIMIYNDAYVPMLGAKHPRALGRPVREVWSDIWSAIEPRINSVVHASKATWDEALPLFMERSGLAEEETYFTFSYSPLIDDHGDVAGLFCAVTEETQRVISVRRMASLTHLSAKLAGTTTENDVLAAVSESLATNGKTFPFAALYLFDESLTRARLAATAGIAPGHAAAPEEIDLESGDAIWPLVKTAQQGTMVVENLRSRFAELPTGAWTMQPRSAVLVRIARGSPEGAAGVLVVGTNPHRPVEEFRNYFELVAGQIASSLANARAHEDERKRIDALGALDKAKTAFFSNVSHEFRTPLTLLLGPLEDAKRALGKSAVAVGLDVAHRNALRLLRLVNSLLDFSRIEAGRVQAAFQPTDLSALTRDLASTFRSATDRARIELEVNAGELRAPVYVDREMWEKIVLNLLSNAFKHTFKGSIIVTLRDRESFAELEVRDTGVGIDPDQLEHIFERFHRVPNARSRTHEGTGIGLSLVQELVKLHGGRISVESEVGKGSRFKVAIPFGKAHLPREQVAEHPLSNTSSGVASSFVEEAMRWSPESASGEYPASGRSDRHPELREGETPAFAALRPTSARVLLADDSADMRDYVARLLREQGWEVEAVADGEAAIASAKANPPDLVLTDVMMPRLDGRGLVRALRQDDKTATLPILLLSARAGDEAKVEGMEMGADDYLVKPFSSQELTARVRAHLSLGALRKRAFEAERRLRAEAELLRTEAERANRAKTDFLATMSHELRTPLNAIAGHLQLIEMGIHGEVTPAQHAAIDRIDMSQRHLLRLINDVLNLARIESGRLEYRITDVFASEIIVEVTPIVEAQLASRRLRFTVDLPEEPVHLRVDREKLVQILLNLLSNAIKFTPPDGTITLSVVEQRAQGKGMAAISVTDTGIGVPKDKLAEIFEPFVQAHRSRSSPMEGAGLGLAISRDLARGMGGDLRAESEEGVGSRFTVLVGLSAE